MLELQKVKKISGMIALPPNPDYFFLCLLVSLCSDKQIQITPVIASPLVAQFKKIFSAHLKIDQQGMDCFVTPKNQDNSSCILLPYDVIPFRDFSIAFLLGLKKKITISNVPSECFMSWQKKASQCNIFIETTQDDDVIIVTVTDGNKFQITDNIIHQNDIHFCLGLALGLKEKLQLHLNYHYQSPLRQLLTAFGYNISVKNTSERIEKDPLIRRLQFLSPKLRKKQKSTFSFSLQFDPCQPNVDHKIVVILPGDDILASVFLTAKSLVPRGQLLIENVCIEPWSNVIISLLRKMGCSISIEETCSSSFGSVGKINLNKFKLVGQKMDCKPLFQYIRQLPSMIILVTFAKGRSVFRSLDELRSEMPSCLTHMITCIDRIGGRYGEMPDGIVIDGTKEYDGFDIPENYSPGLNAACAVAGLKCNGKSTIADDFILHRWPDFPSMIDSVCEIQ